MVKEPLLGGHEMLGICPPSLTTVESVKVSDLSIVNQGGGWIRDHKYTEMKSILQINFSTVVKLKIRHVKLKEN